MHLVTVSRVIVAAGGGKVTGGTLETMLKATLVFIFKGYKKHTILLMHFLPRQNPNVGVFSDAV